MKKQQLRNPVLLLLAAAIWGSAFVAQSTGSHYVGAFTFNCMRSVIACIVLIPCIFFLDKFSPSERRLVTSSSKKTLLLGGVLCGILLFAASNLQQLGIANTTVGKAGFITAFYIVLVPVFGIFLRHKTGPFVWLGVFFALFGLYFLCMSESVSIKPADLLLLLCAFIFTTHILVIDKFSPLVDGVRMSLIQFFVCAILSSIFMLIFEQPSITQIFTCWFPILYAGAFSSGIAYTLQIVGQKNMNPTVASLLLSCEALFSVLSGWLFLGEQLTSREILGCILMSVAILLAQLPFTSSKKAAS